MAIFGLVPGFLISWIGEILGSIVTYWLYGKGVTWFLHKQQRNWKWQRSWRDMSRRKQFTALLLARITPAVPSAFVTIAALASSIPFGVYLFATIIGKLPSIAMETLLMHDLLFLKEHAFRFMISLALLLALYLYLRKQTKKFT